MPEAVNKVESIKWQWNLPMLQITSLILYNKFMYSLYVICCYEKIVSAI